MRVRFLAAAVMLMGFAMAGSAQTGTAAAARAAGTMMSPAQSADEVLNLFEHEAMGVVNAMPADKYDFAPAAANFASGQGTKYEGVRTFAKEVSHVAQANYYFYSTLSGLKPDVDVKAIGAMTSKEQLVAALQGSFAFGHRAIATITRENAFESIKGVDGIHTRQALADFAVAHGYDHYGQMVEYLRMNGIVPPGSK
jgi:uncharacterized damage-inducible protein DinB